jgi:hypothetical protein
MLKVLAKYRDCTQCTLSENGFPLAHLCDRLISTVGKNQHPVGGRVSVRLLV